MSATVYTQLSHDDSLSVEQQERLAAILDEYLVSVESGVPLPLDSLVERHSDLKEQLLPYLGGLELLQDAAVGFRGSDSGKQADYSPNDGCRLGDFELLQEIGRGGMGVVYEARQISLDRRVALKVLPFAAVLESKQIQRFKNEAQAAAQVHHPNIVPVYAVGQERGVYYYAMQFVEGQPIDGIIRDLRQKVKRGNVADAIDGDSTALSSLQQSNRIEYYRSVARLGQQAASALHAAHEYGIVHRDIKPSNLLLDARGKIWLTDFGLARCRSTSDLTRTGDLVGTMRYMSPEQATGKPWKVDHRTDVYALGATLYELLTLVPVMPGRDGPGLLRNIEQLEPKHPRRLVPDLPVDLETIVLKAISKSRSDRYATAEAMSTDLARFQDGLPTIAQPPSLTDRMRRWTHRHSSLVRAVAGFAGLAAIGLMACVLLVLRENGEKRVALEEAKASIRLAQANYAQARDAVDRLGASVAEKLADVQGAEFVRRALLDDTLRYYESFVEQADDDPSLHLDIALTHTKIAEIAEQTGRMNDAIASYRTAAGMLYRLAEKNEGEVGNHLALCRNNLALLLADQGEHEEATNLLNEAAEMQCRLLKEDEGQPLSGQLSADLARTQNNLGFVLEKVGDFEAARAKFLAAAETQRRLLATSPQDAGAMRDFSATLNNLSLLSADSEPQVAIEYAAEARALLQHLATKLPDNQEIRRDMALAENNLGALHARRGELGEATARYEASVQIVEKLLRESPNCPRYRRDLAVTCNNLGRVQTASGDSNSAVASFQLALDIQNDLVALEGKDPTYLSSLAGIYNNLGIALLDNQKTADASRAFSMAIKHQRRAIDLAPDVDRFRYLLDTHFRNLERIEPGARPISARYE
jgi:hypothetical protein